MGARKLVNLQVHLAILLLITCLLAFSTAFAPQSDNLYHDECGESPIKRYKDLAVAIGWDLHHLLKFMKTEQHEEYTKLLRAVKLYADCLTLSKIPL